MEILGSKNPARDWPRRLVVGLAALQLADAIGNALVSRRDLSAHLDHLGVPNRLRPALPVIKGGATAATSLVTFYAPRLISA